jgi:hypothetical protein
LRRYAALSPQRGDNSVSNRATNWNLYSFLYFLQNYMDFFEKT